MFAVLFRNVTNKEKTEAIAFLAEHSTPSKDFFFMVTLSVIMTTFGLLLDSPAVVVGSMLIAPMLYPVLSFAMGLTMLRTELIIKSFLTILKATTLSIFVAFCVAVLFPSSDALYSGEVAARGVTNSAYALVGAVAGLAASFALVKPKLSESLPGVAVAVALIPPLGVVGIALEHVNYDLLLRALALYGLNILGVISTAYLVFFFMDFYTKRTAAVEAVRAEEEKIRQEEKRAQSTPA